MSPGRNAAPLSVRLSAGESETGDPDLSKQLEATFTAAGVVKSYSFSSNFPEDMETVR